MKTIFIISGIIVIGLFIFFAQKPIEQMGSVASGNEYHSISTGVNGTSWDMVNTLQTGQGVFGSIVLTTAGIGEVTFYDATTSNVNLRGVANTTSTLNVLADIETTTPGTYTFDTIFTKGLLMVWSGIKATLGTTTITFKP